MPAGDDQGALIQLTQFAQQCVVALEGAAQPVRAIDVQVAQLAAVELRDQVAEGFQRVGVVDVAEGAHGRNADADLAAVTHRRHHGIDDLQHQTRAVLHRTAVGVAALVAVGAEELVEQVAVGGMHFHAVETGLDGIGSALSISGHDSRQLMQLQGARLGGGGLVVAAIGLDHIALGVGLNGRRGDRVGAARLQQRVGDAPDVPELQEDAPAGLMHGLGDLLPAGDLFGTVDARCPGIALALRADLASLMIRPALAR